MQVPDFVTILREVTPGAYGIWTLVLMGAGWFFREWRETRKLSADDRLARREGYAAQVQMLMAENRLLLKDLHDMREEYDNHRKLCHLETEQLRGMIIELEREVEALKRLRAQDAVVKAKTDQKTIYEQALAAREARESGQ